MPDDHVMLAQSLQLQMPHTHAAALEPQEHTPSDAAMHDPYGSPLVEAVGGESHVPDAESADNAAAEDDDDEGAVIEGTEARSNYL